MIDPELRDWIERRFALPPSGASKATTLDRAIAGHVRPGDTVHLGITHSRGSAAFWELLRRFRGTDPGFTFVAAAASSPFAPLIHAGLARKVITAWAGDSYWTPGPNPAYQRAWSRGVAFEHWSLLTLVERLAAAARGDAWAVTGSLIGSTMAENDGVRVLDDGTAMVPALAPDVSIFHAPAASAEGDVLFSPPLMEGLWGALAARRGAIVTAERIVEPEFIRAHAHMTKLPAARVLAVVEAPLGAHPGGLVPAGIEGVGGYAEDYEFWVDIREASRDPAAMDAWIEQWVTPGPAAYVDRLGDERIERLRARLDPAGYWGPVGAALDETSLSEPPTAIETAIVAGARLIGESIDRGGEAILAGAGMASLAAWLAAFAARDRGVRVDLVAEMGLVGYWPRPGEPILFNPRNFPTCTMLTDIAGTLGGVIGGGRARGVGALGAAQVDKHGNVNSTEIPGERLLMGSGGANDVLSRARETVLIVPQSQSRFLDRVPYVTGPGDRVSALASTLGVFRKVDGELVLTEVFADDVAAGVRAGRARCGWDVKVAPEVARATPPSPDELTTLRLMDPAGYFRGKQRS
ncbi:MAG TPA: CoA-transferase [Actinomycetota bacterium]